MPWGDAIYYPLCIAVTCPYFVTDFLAVRLRNAMPYSEFPKSTSPRRTEGGIKAQSKRGDFAKHWWADRWIKALERLVDAGRLRRGRSYARNGQVQSIREKQGGVEARVQGSRPTPYKVIIELQPLSDRQWAAVIDALAERAIFSAQLLAGEMPQEIEEAFTAAGVTLFPDTAAELVTECTCPDWANPCKHVAAVHYILGEQFDEDPFLLFRLRGRDQAQIIAALRSRRSDAAGAEMTLHEEEAAYQAAESAPSLAEAIDRFWTIGASATQVTVQVKPPLTPLSALKRLGQPAFLPENLEALLGPAYQAISEAAIPAYEEAGQVVDAAELDADGEQP